MLLVLDAAHGFVDVSLKGWDSTWAWDGESEDGRWMDGRMFHDRIS